MTIVVPSGSTPSPSPSSRRRHRRMASAAIAYGVVALAAIVAGSAFGNVHGPQLHTKLQAWVPAAVFVVFGVLAVRRLALLAGHIVAVQTVAAAGSAVRIVADIVGYVLVLFATLGLLDVSIEHLLVGGAVTGVVLGIAAQQSLGNVFAGIVLLMARPFVVGDHILVRSGALGGEFHGVVVAMSLTYVTVLRDGTPLKIPNAGMLAAAVGPYTEPAS